MKNLTKKLFGSIFCALGLVLTSASNSWAIELDDAVRTIPLNGSKTLTLTPEQVKRKCFTSI